MTLRRTALALCLLVPGLLALTVAPARAQDYAAIVAQSDRTDADRITDKKRDPVNLLTFAAPKTGASVLDMGAGAGYSTELMARAVGPTGKVYAQNANVSEKLTARLATPPMAKVVALTRPFDDPTPADVTGLDLITFFFAYHDTTFQPVDRAKMNQAMFAALRPGGLLILADHAARPEDGTTVGKTLHRIAEHSVRTELEAAGFVFVAAADFLRHPEDERTAVVFRNPTPVDEFVLKFRKP